jgi:hypothetical protein
MQLSAFYGSYQGPIHHVRLYGRPLLYNHITTILTHVRIAIYNNHGVTIFIIALRLQFAQSLISASPFSSPTVWSKRIMDQCCPTPHLHTSGWIECCSHVYAGPLSLSVSVCGAAQSYGEHVSPDGPYYGIQPGNKLKRCDSVQRASEHRRSTLFYNISGTKLSSTS